MIYLIPQAGNQINQGICLFPPGILKRWCISRLIRYEHRTLCLDNGTAASLWNSNNVQGHRVLEDSFFHSRHFRVSQGQALLAILKGLLGEFNTGFYVCYNALLGHLVGLILTPGHQLPDCQGVSAPYKHGVKTSKDCPRRLQSDQNAFSPVVTPQGLSHHYPPLGFPFPSNRINPF